MKFILMLLLASTAIANDRIADPKTWSDEVSYLGWCEDNQVMTQSEQGQVVVQFDCLEENKVCREKTVRRANRSIVTAACVNP